MATLRRRWVAVVVCAAMTVVGAYHYRQLHGVYWASVSVALRPPDLAHHVVPESGAPIPLAAIIEQRIRAVHPVPPSVSPNVTIVDRGIYDGWTVDLPDYGGQWAINVPSPTLVVQASGPDPEVVVQRIDAATARIGQLLDEFQNEAGVSVANRVRAERLQPTADVNYAVGTRTRALMSVALLGGLLSLTVPLALDRLAGMTRRRTAVANDSSRSICRCDAP